eukprot:TRINITY_DN11644_c0_g1_i1.p1 TRINITY_DN11644_c0_g1~~TRINITY_DN11644_c0_g1_i1.p1  ORF type:complete len:445 (+),score=147.04 TRINITY_DN11644_c0_g1_i1:76-1335(+)
MLQAPLLLDTMPGGSPRRAQEPWYLQAHPVRDPDDRGGAWQSPRPADGELRDWYSDFPGFELTANDWGKERMRQQQELFARTGGLPQGRDPPPAEAGQQPAEGEQGALPEEAQQEGRYAPGPEESLYSESSCGDAPGAKPLYMDNLSYDPKIHDWQKQWQQQPGARILSGPRRSPEELRALAFRRFAGYPSPPPSAQGTPRAAGSPPPPDGGMLRADSLLQALAAAGFAGVAPGQAQHLAAQAGARGGELSFVQFEAVCLALTEIRRSRANAFRALQHGVPGRGPCIYGFDLPMALAAAGHPDLDESQLAELRQRVGLRPGDRIDLRAFDALCNLCAEQLPSAGADSPRAYGAVHPEAAPAVPGSPEWQPGGGDPVPGCKAAAAKPSPRQRMGYEKAMAQKIDLPTTVQARLRPPVQSL